MYRCWNCGSEFNEPDIEHTSYEQYYGVSSMFANEHSLTLEVCPSCCSDEIEEYDDEESFW